MTSKPGFEQIRRYARTAWQRRWWGLAVAWMICLVGWGVIYALPDKYRASARIFADADAVLGSLLRGLAIDNSPAGQVEVLQRTLLSRPNLETIIVETSLGRDLDDSEREALVNRLSRDIRMTSYGRNLFMIDYQDRSPDVAYEVVAKAVQLFTIAVTGSDREQYNKARQFLEEQLTLYETRLRDAEQRRAAFRQQYIDLLPSETYGGASRLEAGRGRLRQLQGELEDARKRHDLVRLQLENVSPTLSAAAAAAMGIDGGGRLGEAERQLRELRLRFTEQHPDVITARALVADLRANGGDRRVLPGETPRPNPLYEQLKIRQVDADAEVASLERQMRDSEAEVSRLEAALRAEPEVQAQFTNLDRDYNVLRRNYEELLARRESVSIANAARNGSDRVQLEVVDPPTVPTLPYGPPRKLFMGGVLLVGLGAGVALTLTMAQFDKRFYTVQDLRALGLPVLGSISAPEPSLVARLRTGVTFVMACGLLLAVFCAAVFGRALFVGIDV